MDFDEEAWDMIDLDILIATTESPDIIKQHDLKEIVEKKYLEQNRKWLEDLRPYRDHILMVKNEVQEMKANQDALISNLKQADAGLEKFLELIEKTNQKQKSLNERERLLQELYSLPINDSTLLKNLFKEKTNQTGIKSLLNDLMTYHNLVATIDKLKEIEASLATNSDAESLEIPQSALRKSMEENLRQVSFKAIQCTVGLVNKDIVSLLQLPEKALVRVLKPICQLKEIKPVLFSQYCSHQKLRIKDVISSWQVSVRKGQIEVFFSLVLESLARFCIYDLSVFLGVFGNKNGREAGDLISSIYADQFEDISQQMKKMFGQQTQPLDVGQLTSLMKSTMMFWNVLTSLETLYSNLVGSSTSSRLPEFLINFESTLTMAENFIDKQLQMASNRFDKVNKDCLTPSTIAEVSRSISALHNFYATIIPSSRSMYLASVDSLLYPLRSFTILGKRLTTEKPTLNSLLFGAQLIARLHHVAKTTRISTLAGAFIQKQRQALDESMDLLAKALVDNVKDIIKKQKDPLKRDIFEMSFKADPSNPNFLAFDSLRDIKNSEAKQVLVEKYIQYLEQSFPKYFTELNSQQDHLSGKTALLTFILNTTRTQ